jgi:hypothetical protein
LVHPYPQNTPLYTATTALKQHLSTRATTDLTTLNASLEEVNAEFNRRMRIHMLASNKPTLCAKRLLALKRAAFLVVEDFERKARGVRQAGSGQFGVEGVWER